MASKKQTVSDWSNPNTPPTKPGVYEIKPEYSTGHRMYAYFEDNIWYAESSELEFATTLRNGNHIRNTQQVTWRGIVK